MQHDAKTERSEPPSDDCASQDMASMLAWVTGNGQEHRAYRAMDRGDYEEARRLLEPVAARGSAYALLALGGIYEWGRLGAPDTNAAISHYERAASNGSAEAFRRLGRLFYELGRKGSARAAFEGGADAGNVSCIYWLGLMKLEGEGGDQDIGGGVELLKVAAEQGHLFAKRKLLSIELAGASIFEKLRTFGCIGALGLKVAIEMWKDPDSDMLR